MFQWQSARRTSGEKEGTWQEKVPSSVEEDTGDCISSAHSHLTPTLCQWCVLMVHSPNPPLSLHPPSHSPHPPPLSPHPPMFTSTPSTLLVVQYWCSWSQRATLGSEWNRKSLGNLRSISGQQPHTQPIMGLYTLTALYNTYVLIKFSNNVL